MTSKVSLGCALVAFVNFSFPVIKSSKDLTLAQQQPAPAATPKPTTPAIDSLAVELSFWQTIKDSKNPDDFKAYLNKYPHGEFAELAKNRINSLSSADGGPESPAFDQLLERHIHALGDKAAIEKMTTLVLKGPVELTVNGQTVNGTTERCFKFPDKSFVSISTPIGNLTQGIDGTVGWKNLGQGPVEMNAWETAFQNRTNLLFTHITHVDQFKSAYKSFLVRGHLDLNGRNVQVVDAIPLNGQRETLYFDAATGLLYRWDLINEGEGAGKQRNELYADEYAEINGVKVPKAIHVVTPTATVFSRFTDIKTNVALDESLFAKH